MRSDKAGHAGIAICILVLVKYLAKLGNVSESSFNRKFKKELQLTPMEYLMEVRMEQAKKLLRRKEIPITQVALRCGFGSGAHLLSVFCLKNGKATTWTMETNFEKDEWIDL